MNGTIGLDLGVNRLIEVAELKLLLLAGVQELLLCASRGGIQGIVVLLVGLRRWRVVRHLRKHPVVYLELR